ncbi:hypothetical protein [Bremerella alba]|uniref:Uncharacterized protein n=1 Tax=Bremerella alba TaxID=980252 RepID=A0A7V9A935_9BACT|nr:hypothetical protein [Bremerella alba]MBA2117062.1 hypothetical protein [Bremerella alba]
MRSSDNELVSMALLSAEREISRLIATYPHLLDAGKFDELAKLLQHATLEVSDANAGDQAAIEQFLVYSIRRHENGTRSPGCRAAPDGVPVSGRCAEVHL